VEIQTVDGMLDKYENLVLHGDVSFLPGSVEIDKFVANVYETTTEELPRGEFPLFCVCGTRIEEWSAAFTLLDFLLGGAAKARVRSKMDTWLFEVQALEQKFSPITIQAHSVLCQIRYKGEFQDISVPELRFSDSSPAYSFQSYPSRMVFKRVQKAP